ncbi:MAG: diguanylate cyclase, partial [Xanthobacteraceae bacterium]|nr:diguanylate cyclase [Xanthobacteraceae bacterium]
MTDAAGPGPDQIEEMIAARLAQLTAQLQAREQDLRNQNILFNAALTNMSQGLVMFDTQGRVVICNQRYLDMYGLTTTQVHPGSTMIEVLRHRLASGSFSGDPEVYAREILGRIPGPRTSKRIVELPDGRTIAISNQPTPGGGWVATHEDITERRRAEEQIAHMARHDALTGLPNRARLREWLAHALSHSHHGRPLAMLHLDLDHFMTLNDSLGHPIGDELLRAVGDRLRDLVPDKDLVARLGADEFAVVVTNIETVDDCASVATHIADAIRVPFEIAGHTILVDMSIGIAVAPGDGTEADALIKNADLALSRAKAEQRGSFRFFELEMNALAQARRETESQLRDAIERKVLQPHYQPLVDLHSGRITGVEALIRWPHPIRGMVSPLQFIPIAEET